MATVGWGIFAQLTRKHRPERLSTENVHVQVRDLLPGALPNIGKHPIALDHELLITRDFADRADKAGNLLV
jgi:hypothetical protein